MSEVHSYHFILYSGFRDASVPKFGWIFGKLPKGEGGVISDPKYFVADFCGNFCHEFQESLIPDLKPSLADPAAALRRHPAWRWGRHTGVRSMPGFPNCHLVQRGRLCCYGRPRWDWFRDRGMIRPAAVNGPLCLLLAPALTNHFPQSPQRSHQPGRGRTDHFQAPLLTLLTPTSATTQGIEKSIFEPTACEQMRNGKEVSWFQDQV